MTRDPDGQRAGISLAAPHKPLTPRSVRTALMETPTLTTRTSRTRSASRPSKRKPHSHVFNSKGLTQLKFPLELVVDVGTVRDLRVIRGRLQKLADPNTVTTRSQCPLMHGGKHHNQNSQWGSDSKNKGLANEMQ